MVNVTSALFAVKGAAMRPLRVGKRRILWTPDHGLGFGNFLYLYLRAHILKSHGVDYRVLETPDMRRWLDAYPSIREELTIKPGDVRLWDRREWDRNRLFQKFGEDFSREQLRAFAHEHLWAAECGAGTVVVNIRRGDYYTTFAHKYSFDVPAYVTEAIKRAAAHQPINEIRVVSDDLNWCRENLDDILSEHSPVEYAVGTPFENFRDVCTPRLIGTNSTFSYWGGYVGGTSASSHIIMPRFHARDITDGDAYQLDPDWDVVESLPNGWAI